MKTLSKTLLGATAAAALATASASPAQAQYRHNDGIDAGEVIAGALIIGGIAAIAAAVSNNDDDRYDRRYDPRYDDRYDRNRRGQYNRGLSPRAAVNQCVAAAQQEASRYGRARVTEVTDIDRKRNGYEIEGRVVVDESRYGRNNRYGRNARYDRDYDRGSFECRIRYGRIDRVRVRGI